MKQRIYLSERGSNYGSWDNSISINTYYIGSTHKFKEKQSIRSNAENFSKIQPKNILKTVNKRSGNGSIKSDTGYQNFKRRFGSKILPSEKDSFKQSWGGTPNHYGKINIFSKNKLNKKEKKNIL